MVDILAHHHVQITKVCQLNQLVRLLSYNKTAWSTGIEVLLTQGLKLSQASPSSSLALKWEVVRGTEPSHGLFSS